MLNWRPIYIGGKQNWRRILEIIEIPLLEKRYIYFLTNRDISISNRDISNFNRDISNFNRDKLNIYPQDRHPARGI